MVLQPPRAVTRFLHVRLVQDAYGRGQEFDGSAKRGTRVLGQYTGEHVVESCGGVFNCGVTSLEARLA